MISCIKTLNWFVYNYSPFGLKIKQIPLLQYRFPVGFGLTILRVGYFLSTSIFLVLSYIILGERRWLLIFLLSFPFVAIFMYLLHGLLNIYLRDPFLQYIGVMG